MAVVFYCDRCRSEIRTDPIRLKVRTSYSDEYGKRFFLCNGCYNKVVNFITKREDIESDY